MRHRLTKSQLLPLVQRPVGKGFGDNALAWEPQLSLDRPANDRAYDVSISNVVINGSPKNFNYRVTIIDTNRAPTDIQLSSTSVAENKAAGTIVATFSGIDPDQDNLSYSLVGGTGDSDNASFKIVGANLQTNAVLNYEQRSNLTIRVQVNDGRASGTYEKIFNINVVNVNDAPSDLALSSDVVAENQPKGTKIGAISATDEDSADTFTYALVSGDGSFDNGAFQIAGGELFTNMPLDYETHPIYAVRVEVRDAGGAAFSKAFTIKTTNTNDPPVFTSKPTKRAQPDVAYRYAIRTSDQDVGDSRTISSTTTLPVWLNLTDAGDGTAILSGLPTTSTLGVFAITLQVRDAQGAVSEQRFDIRVAPEIALHTSGSTASTTENGWPFSALIDGNTSTSWSSKGHTDHLASSDWAVVFLPSATEIDRVQITPRSGPDGLSLGFPKDFVLQYAVEGQGMTCNPQNPNFTWAGNWRPLVTRFGYPQPNNSPIDFIFDPLQVQCVRLFGTELSQDDYGNRFMQLAEMTLFQQQK
jgi:hypothetical protein